MSPTRSRKQRPVRFNNFQNENEKATKKRSKVLSLIAGVAIIVIAVGLITFCLDTTKASSIQKRNSIGLARTHVARTLNKNIIEDLTTHINIYHLKEQLIKILIPRPPGSVNISIVKQFIVSTLDAIGGWDIELDSFQERAPEKYGLVNFTNIIASYNPSAKRKLILACHYDSKILSEGQFVGATDSAVPCAMMLEIAHALSSYLKSTDEQNSNNVDSVGLQLVFLDGEEAFIEWTSTDSIYGARHLAKQWKTQKKLQNIDLFILLDLIGTSDTAFYNFTVTGSRWFDHAVNIEKRLRSYSVIPPKQHLIFREISRTNRFLSHRIEDDHIPFLNQDVPIMHLITVPFPKVWHQLSDNLQSLDFDRIYCVTSIMTVFVAEYLGLTPPPLPSWWWSWWL